MDLDDWVPPLEPQPEHASADSLADTECRALLGVGWAAALRLEGSTELVWSVLMVAPSRGVDEGLPSRGD